MTLSKFDFLGGGGGGGRRERDVEMAEEEVG